MIEDQRNQSIQDSLAQSIEQIETKRLDHMVEDVSQTALQEEYGDEMDFEANKEQRPR